MTEEFEYEVQSFWETPVVKIHNNKAEEFNARLAQIIRQKEKEITSKGKPTPVGGLTEGISAHWMEYNVLKWDYPECQRLKDMVLEGFQVFLNAAKLNDKPGMEIVGISCWANIIKPGQAIQVHHHDPSFCSVHYTVTTGMEGGKIVDPVDSDSGETIYFRPGFMDRSHGGVANGVVSPWDDDWRIRTTPKPGRLTFFPSYVRHEVRPNHGTSDRISIAMDIFVKRNNAMMHFGGPRWFVPGKD